MAAFDGDGRMTNPISAPDAGYAVLCNQQNQHSLWPADIAVPDGWTIVHGPSTRAECITFVSERWPDVCVDDVADCIAGVAR